MKPDHKTFPRLMAKSDHRTENERAAEPMPPSLTLPGHLEDVCTAAGQVVDATGRDQLAALGLGVDKWLGRFRRAVALAAAVHDLGKANDHFQRMLTAPRSPVPVQQGLRHEWVTTLMLAEPALREWLRPADMSDDDLRVVRWAVAGHHAKYQRPSPPRQAPGEGEGDTLTMLMGHADFAECLRRIGGWFGLGPAPELVDRVGRLVGSGNVFNDILRQFRIDGQVWREWEDKQPDLRRFAAAVKNCVIAGDIAGSALPREVTDPAKRAAFIPDSFACRPTPEDLREVVDARLGGKTLRKFQADVADRAKDVTFVKAGCGSGKTLAAYHWARIHAPGRRLWFCYPTTGTATEGFRDYLTEEIPSAGAGTPGETERRAKSNARLFHGRSEVDIDMLGVRDEPADEAFARLTSFHAWSTRIATCTVDTVLGLVQNNRSGLYAWPALAGAAFVFDEIHAFDDRLFGALLRFLTDLRVPVLLMTASLPKAWHECLKRVLDKAGRTLSEIAGPDDLETLARYHRKHLPDGADPLDAVKDEIAAGGKVLWVCNTVDRAMKAADRARGAGLAPLIYHSRYRYEDRVQRHKAVIDAFQGDGPALAICTQVAEMSLDLSASLLVTDTAPVPALIQRMGRLNRRARPPETPGQPPPPTMPFVIVEPDSHKPYEAAQLADARTWLDKLGDGKLSQKSLADAWEQEGAGRGPVLIGSAWLDGGPETTVTELRESSPGITVVLHEDRHRADIVRVALPMPVPPKQSEWQKWDRTRKGRLPVAPPGWITYDKERGGEWIRK